MSHFNGFVTLLLILTIVFNRVSTQKPPNIVMIMSDDMGFNDIGFHGSTQIPTPNIDALAAYGITLNRYYVSPICTPSRVALMTGKYPSNVGMHHLVIGTDQPYGLGLKEKLMPEYLKEAGYNTHIIGKWHLGFYKKEYTPTFRGFDSHFGCLSGGMDYYNHSAVVPAINWDGLDMRRNLQPDREYLGSYATDFFTQESIKVIRNHDTDNPLFLYIPHFAPHAIDHKNDPLPVPQEVFDKFAYINNQNRRAYAAAISILDDSVGAVVKELNEKQMLNNTVILFFCDNGAPVEGYWANGGSNNPFRGQKLSAWEGGVRSAGVIWSPLLQSRERTSNQLFHITDWLPTFAALAGVSVDSSIDGRNIWPSLSNNLDSPRNDVLLHLENFNSYHYQAYINGTFKYLNGTTFNGSYDGWLDYINLTESHPMFQNYGESIMNSSVGRAIARYSLTNLSALAIETHRQSSIITCNNVEIPTDTLLQCFPLKSPCLFNIIEDPCERRNIAALRPDILDMMQNEVNRMRLISQPIRNKPKDERSNPANFNNTWTWWFDELGIADYEENTASCNSRFIIIPIMFMIMLTNIGNIYT